MGESSRCNNNKANRPVKTASLLLTDTVEAHEEETQDTGITKGVG